MSLRASYFGVSFGLIFGGLAIVACSSDGGTPGGGSGGTGTPAAGSGSGGTSVVPQGGSATTAGTAGATVAGSSTGGGTSMAGTGGASGGTGGNAVAGSGGASGGTGGSGGGSKMSPGCGKDNADDPTKWIQHDIAVQGLDAAFSGNPAYTTRRYWTKTPNTYDKATPMPLVIWGQGCGQGGTAENVPPNQGPEANQVLQIQLLAPQTADHCYSAGPDGDNAKSPELAYFDQLLTETLNNFCIDTSKVFLGGYSSGGWFTSLMACNRATKLRGVGWAAAGLQKNHDECMGPVAAIITRGEQDTGTPLDQTLAARDDLIKRNKCTMDTKPWAPGNASFDSSSCLEYQGCTPGYPVVWCPTPGGHTNTVNDTHLSTQGFWYLWSTLP
jgi:hypothetical protein